MTTQQVKAEQQKLELLYELIQNEQGESRYIAANDLFRSLQKFIEVEPNNHIPIAYSGISPIYVQEGLIFAAMNEGITQANERLVSITAKKLYIMLLDPDFRYFNREINEKSKIHYPDRKVFSKIQLLIKNVC